jgi:hypothetical protein
LGEKKNIFRIMAQKPEGKRMLGRHNCRYNKIQVDFAEIKYKWLE